MRFLRTMRQTTNVCLQSQRFDLLSWNSTNQQLWLRISLVLAIIVATLVHAHGNVAGAGTGTAAFIQNGYDRSRAHRKHRAFVELGSSGQVLQTQTKQIPFPTRLSTTISTMADDDTTVNAGRYNEESAFSEYDADASNEEHRQRDNSNNEEATYQINLQIAELIRGASRQNVTAADMALKLLRTHLQNDGGNGTSYPSADTVAYNSVLKAYAKTSSPTNLRAGKIAYKLLEEMEELHKKQTKASLLWFQRNRDKNLTSEEFVRGPPRVKVKPNVRSYSICMDCFARQRSVQGATMAQNLLKQLQSKYYDDTDGEDFAYLPNSVCYNTVLNAWSKSGTKLEGATKCEQLLYEMIDLQIADTISFNAACHAWARSGEPDAGRYAERLLDEMVEYVKPNARTYSVVIDAWGRSFGCDDSAQRAHALLNEMEDLADDGDSSMRPNYITYSTVINAYARSKSEPFKAHKAYALLQRMAQQSSKNNDPTIRPNCVTYNTVLNAIASSNPNTVYNNEGMSDSGQEEKSQQIKLSELPTLPDMVRTLYSQLLESDLEPDHYTFGTVLKAVANLFWSEPDREEFCKQVFQKACDLGYVSFGVLFQLKQAAPADVYRSLLPEKAYIPVNGHVIMKHIPRNWTRNAREYKRYNKGS